VCEVSGQAASFGACSSLSTHLKRSLVITVLLEYTGLGNRSTLTHMYLQDVSLLSAPTPLRLVFSCCRNRARTSPASWTNLSTRRMSLGCTSSRSSSAPMRRHTTGACALLPTQVNSSARIQHTSCPLPHIKRVCHDKHHPTLLLSLHPYAGACTLRSTLSLLPCCCYCCPQCPAISTTAVRLLQTYCLIILAVVLAVVLLQEKRHSAVIPACTSTQASPALTTGRAPASAATHAPMHTVRSNRQQRAQQQPASQMCARQPCIQFVTLQPAK
jgi:hypothetical protein